MEYRQFIKIMAKIENKRYEFTKDELVELSKYVDNIIVERFIEKG